MKFWKFHAFITNWIINVVGTLTTKKNSKKKHAENIKIFLQMKNTKAPKKTWEWYQNFIGAEKEKKVSVSLPTK